MSKEIDFENRDRFLYLGISIASMRKAMGLTQEELAQRAKISRSQLSAIETPNIERSFSVDALFKIADALNIRAGDLLNSIYDNNYNLK